MSKSTVTKLFLGSVIAVIAGVVLGFAAVWYAYLNDAFVMSGPESSEYRQRPEHGEWSGSPSWRGWPS